MYFFKYRPPGNLEFNMLRHGELFFASVSELNDPHECAPYYIFSGSTELWRRFIDLVLWRACHKNDVHPLLSDESRREILNLADPLSDHLKKKFGRRDVRPTEVNESLVDELRSELEKTSSGEISQRFLRHVRLFFRDELPELLSEATYIASFCKSITSQAVWAKYANAEQGFAIILRSDSGSINVESDFRAFFETRPGRHEGIKEIGRYKESSISLEEVTYRKKPAKINAFHRLIPHFRYSEREWHYDVPLLIPEEANDKEESLFGLVKDSDWRDEQEVRAVFRPASTLDPASRTFRIDTDQIAGIVFGPLMSKEDKRRAITCSRALLKDEFIDSDESVIAPDDFGLFQAVRSEGQYELSIKPFGLVSHNFGLSRGAPCVGIEDISNDNLNRLNEIAQSLVG